MQKNMWKNNDLENLRGLSWCKKLWTACIYINWLSICISKQNFQNICSSLCKPFSFCLDTDFLQMIVPKDNIELNAMSLRASRFSVRFSEDEMWSWLGYSTTDYDLEMEGEAHLHSKGQTLFMQSVFGVSFIRNI